MPNRLASETSPYLLQHRDNPVDWYPWGPEALERSRAEDKPILLSIGYSACHWCHVMEHESFEDSATAALMNEHFVNIKVDREERPDLDSIYMNAVQQMTGHGGWPMTVFLTPAGVPFFGGTYFPPEPRQGMPAFRQILLGVGDAYRNRRGEVNRSASELHGILQQSSMLRAETGDLDTGILELAFHSLAMNFDPPQGGFGGAPKFPQPMSLELLLRYRKRTGSPEALHMTQHTLRKMAGGGMYDHLGGGFHRYSVDDRWLVPHFEKMLYDNALLSRAYLHAFQATEDGFYRHIVEETLGYVLREMRSPEGAFYSSQDADTEGEEGRFYVWTAEQIDALLGPEEGPRFRRYYDVSQRGNWEGHNILHTEAPSEAERDALRAARETLYRARAERVWPDRDEKAITAWNAMMLHSFAEAARVLDNREFRDAAVANAGFLLRELRRGGRLLRTYKDGQAKIPAFLEDYALLVHALLAVYEATWDSRWVREATQLADAMLERFWDDAGGVFYDTAGDAEALVVRPRDLYDNATPSGNSAATGALLRLAVLASEERYARVAQRALGSLAALLRRAPSAFGHLLSALDFHLATPQEVAIIGEPDAEDTAALLNVLRGRFLPNTVVAVAAPTAAAEIADTIPLLRDRAQLDGRATAYVCEHFACLQPVNTPQALESLLSV